MVRSPEQVANLIEDWFIAGTAFTRKCVGAVRLPIGVIFRASLVWELPVRRDHWYAVVKSVRSTLRRGTASSNPSSSSGESATNRSGVGLRSSRGLGFVMTFGRGQRGE
jgi:hypothetical protein